MKAVLIPGDGIGREIAESVREVSAALNTGIEWQEFAAGAEYAAESGELIAPGTLDAIEACGWALKGPTATPIGKGFRSINVQLRQRFSTYANLRPVHTLPGVPTRFDNVDLVIVRENTEDLYKGIEYMLNDEIANGVKLITLKGTFLDTPAPDTLRVREGYLLCENGLCAGFSETAPAGVEVLDYTGKIITPGLVDLHLHAPQYSYCGTAMDLELLDWLQQYTYPEEAHYADPAYARLGYSYFVRDLKNSATTRACIFATLHTDATLELMHQLRGAGLSAFVGKLGMDRNSPDSYREPSAAAGLAETRRWLDTCRAENTLHAGPVRPMITPRFTPSTSDEYMRGLGELAREYNVPAQSHLSENPGEIAWVAELCPGTKFYGESYSRYGLFGGGVPTVMAHCIYSPDDEAALMKQNRVMIAHCPTSNENVIAGIAPAAHYLRGGWRVGLGSDVAGGQTLDLFTVMATAVQVSKLRWRYIDQSEKPLTMVEALYMATVGGGDFWADFGEKVGLFEDGYAFDALVLDDDPLKNMRTFSAAERLERYAYLGKGKLTAKFAAGEKLL